VKVGLVGLDGQCSIVDSCVTSDGVEDARRYDEVERAKVRTAHSSVKLSREGAR